MEYFDLVIQCAVGAQALAGVLLVACMFAKCRMYGVNTYTGRLVLWAVMATGLCLSLALVTYTDMPAVSHSLGIIAAILGCYTGMAFTMLHIVLWGSTEYESLERQVADTYSKTTIGASVGLVILGTLVFILETAERFST